MDALQLASYNLYSYIRMLASIATNIYIYLTRSFIMGLARDVGDGVNIGAMQVLPMHIG